MLKFKKVNRSNVINNNILPYTSPQAPYTSLSLSNKFLISLYIGWSLLFLCGLALKTTKFLVRSCSSFAPRHRHLAGTNNARRLTARVRSNTAKNLREQFSLIQASVQEQTPVVQSPVSTLSPQLEISYFPVSDLSPDFFDDLFPSSPLPVLHPVSPPIEELPISHATPSIPHVQTDAYSPPGHLPLLFHNAQLLEYMFYFIPCTNNRVIVSIVGSSCLFSVPISSLISIDPFSLQPYDPTQL